MAYLEKRGLKSSDLIEAFKLGYCNRTLGYRLPSKTMKAGKRIRQTLKEVGIYRPTMFEHFGGCLVVPVMGEDGSVLEMYGRKIRPDHKIGKQEMKHGYLPGPHKGVWNGQAFRGCDEIILCEALIDAMTFWVHGFKNVTAIYGTSGFSEDLKAAFEAWAQASSSQKTTKKEGHDRAKKRVYLAFDRDEAGDRAAEKYAPWLAERGIEVRRVLFPKKMDANEYALKVQPAAKALDQVLRASEVLAEPLRSAQGLGGADANGKTAKKRKPAP